MFKNPISKLSVKKIICSAFLVCALNPTASFAAGYTGSGTVKTMQSAFGGWLLVMNGLNRNPDNCSKNNILLLPSHPQYDELYSMLLAAHASGKKINVHVDDCHSAGYKIFNFIYAPWNVE